MSVIVVQRQTLDWQTQTLDSYREASVPFCRLWDKPDDFMLGLVNAWNHCFDYDYFHLRQQLKDIASTHNHQLPGCRFIPYAAYGNIPGNGLAYTFIDDDDWLSPDLAEPLLHALETRQAVLWNTCTLGGSQSEHAVFFWGPNGRCMTNNYAVNGDWISEDLTRLDTVCQHKHAFHTLQQLDTGSLNAWLSVTSKTPCSSVSLAHSLGPRGGPRTLVDNLQTYNRKLAGLTRDDFSRALWAWPLVEQTRNLFQTVAAAERT